MTKLVRKMVKCVKCGEESEQLLVYSVNSLLGDKESNDKLMAHKQKCPNCGYEARNISIEKKYDINVEENVPQIVYGIPDWMKEKNEDDKPKKVFEAFYGGYAGTSHYYYIQQVNNEYLFKYGLSKYGKLIFIDSKELLVCKRTKKEYDDFIINLKLEMKDWKDSYVNNDIMDGTQWHIEFTEENKTYSGSNEFPSNMDTVMKILNMIFKEQTKYDVDPEDNVPREVYGIPSPSKYDMKPENNVPQRVYGVPNPNNVPKREKTGIKLSIKNDNANYMMMLNQFGQNVKLAFANENELKNTSIDEVAVNIPLADYHNFIMRINKITEKWENSYSGNGNSQWILEINDVFIKGKYVGNGGYPSNWNEYIDLISEYEILFKKVKLEDKKFNNSFEKMVQDKVKDPFWTKVIVDYFKTELKSSDHVAKKCFEDLSKYDDIFNEFTKYLVQKTYDLKDAISVNGYTAKQLHELQPTLTASGIYTFLQWLRDEPEKAQDVIRKGFPNKDVVPPTVEIKTDDEYVKKCLAEIKPEVDKQLIEMGLLKIEDGKEIPAFGSCHTAWAIQKRLLKERYNIDWQTPAEKNPFIQYD